MIFVHSVYLSYNVYSVKYNRQRGEIKPFMKIGYKYSLLYLFTDTPLDINTAVQIVEQISSPSSKLHYVFPQNNALRLVIHTGEILRMN